MSMTTLTSEQLSNTINQAKSEVKIGLYDLFTSKLERLSFHIRNNCLTATEAAELVDQEVEKIRAQHRGDY